MRYAGTNLARIREERGMTQKALAEKMGLSQTSVSNVENGHVAPWPKLRREAARILGVSEEELFSDTLNRKGSTDRK